MICCPDDSHSSCPLENLPHIPRLVFHLEEDMVVGEVLHGFMFPPPTDLLQRGVGDNEGVQGVVADRGYFNSAEILACDEAGITVTLPKPLTSGNKAKGRFVKQDFR